MDFEADAPRLRRALRDLVALAVVPAAWVGREPLAIAAGLADVLVNSLRLDFAFVRLCDPNGEAAVEIARNAKDRHPYVVGFNLAGDEAGYPPGQFARAYEIASGAGLGCTVHAGEHAGAESVREALTLPVSRISHGVRATEDPELVRELAARGIVLEACPTSNVATGVYTGYETHPLRDLYEAGVKVTLGSDDPPYFGASIGGEYAVARERLGFEEGELRSITRTAIQASFADDALKRALLKRLTPMADRASE